MLKIINPTALQAGKDYQATGTEAVTFTRLTADSRQVQSGTVFAALSGTAHDGRAFIAEAVQKGAAAILTDYEASVPAGIPTIRTTDPRLMLAHLAAGFYGTTPKHIAAVTGTNGKTSTAQFVREIATTLGHPAASIGTLGVIGPNLDHYGTLTTPDAITLHRILAELVEKNITHVCLEASSHGLTQARLEATSIEAAGFTNLTRDHLDFHGTMENYFAAKAHLFNTILQTGGTAVLNGDVPESSQLATMAQARDCKTITYGLHGHDIHLRSIAAHGHGQDLTLDFFGKRHDISLNIVGRFQVWNALCALGLAIGMGMDADQALAALPKLTGVHGRLQHVGTHSCGAPIFIDYAHTPDALETVLNALRPHVSGQGRLLVVFGCGGNRDRGKRPVMGEIAQRLADIAIVTDDNPRFEDAATIRADILSGCQTQPSMHEIADRETAIRTAVEQLNTGDILVIAGKGHEPGQIIGDKVLPFDDGTIARHALKIATI